MSPQPIRMGCDQKPKSNREQASNAHMPHTNTSSTRPEEQEERDPLRAPSTTNKYHHNTCIKPLCAATIIPAYTAITLASILACPAPAKACAGNPLYSAVESPEFRIGIDRNTLSRLMRLCASNYKPPRRFWENSVFISCPSEWWDGGNNAFVFRFEQGRLKSYSLVDKEQVQQCKQKGTPTQ